MHIHSYLKSAQHILATYDGSMPLAAWLKNFFSRHKKFGSKDRKHIAHLCYCYYRLGNVFKEVAVEERLAIALYLCADAPHPGLALLNEGWNNSVALPLKERLQRVSLTANALDIFPWNHQLSNEIDKEAFNLSHLVQPPFYLRIRPGKTAKVKEEFEKNKIAYQMVTENCLAVSSSTRIDAAVDLDKEVVVQDLSSQQVLGVLDAQKLKGKIKVWDCCAASGGKSILFLDTFFQAQLTVSDVRQSILHNLHSRFAKAGIKSFFSFVGDAAKSLPPNEKFDVIICDAPCSGSGTWSRTPEQLHFFTEAKIEYYATLQKSIVANAYKSLKPGGQLLYITCSVFEMEDEAIVEMIKNTLPLQLQKKQYYKGYDKKADTLFAASFTAL